MALRSRGVGAVHSIKSWTGCNRVAMSAFHPKSRAAQLDAPSIDFGSWLTAAGTLVYLSR